MGRIEAGLRAKTIGVQDIVDFSRVNIQLQRLDGATTQIHINSRPNILGEVYDMGRHTHYVNQIALYLRQQSQQYTAENNLGDDFTTEPYNTDVIDDKHKKASDFRE